MNQANSPGSSSSYNSKNSTTSKSINLGSDDSDDDEELMMMMKNNGEQDDFDASLITGSKTDAEKHQSMLLALCTGLGATTWEETEDGTRVRSIEMGEDCQACIADIQRYLRRDDSMKSIFKLLSSWDVVQTRLLPLIYKYQDNKPLQFSATKLVVMLTMPPENSSSDAKDRQARDVVERLRGSLRERKALAFLSVPHVRYLQEMKSSFLKPHVLKCFVEMLTDAWARDGYDRDEHDLRVIELVLSLFRNLLHVPNGGTKHSTSDEHYTHLQEEFIVALEREYIIELLLHLIQNVNDDDTKEWNLLLLEMMYLLLRGQNPATLLASPLPSELIQMNEQRKIELERAAAAEHAASVASAAGANGSSSGGKGSRVMLSPHLINNSRKGQDLNDPLLQITKEERKARAERLDALGSRHSRFGGTLVIRNNGMQDTSQDQPISKQFVWAHNLSDANGTKRRERGGIIRNSSGITNSSLNITRGTRLAQTSNDIAACRTGAADSSVKPSALTVGFGIGGTATVMTAAKSKKVRASLKLLIEEFLTSGYGPLMKSVKNSFVRESDRLLPSDLIQMMYISSFSMQYHRLKLEKEIAMNSSVTFDVNASADNGVGVSLDLWSFRFYTKNIINYMDGKKWVELGVAVSTFKEMIMTVYRMSTKGSPNVKAWSKRLIGVVFYEREIMDLIPSLLMKCHEAKKYIRTWYIADLMETAHAVLNIGSNMAANQMLVRTRRKKKKAKSKAKKEAEEKKKKRWNKEQLFALEEGVRQLGLHKWEQIVRHPQYGPAMGGDRKADEIMKKFEYIEDIKKNGKEIESDPEEEEEGMFKI